MLLSRQQVHVRGGVIIPTQVPAMTTAATRKNPFTLLVALDANKQRYVISLKAGLTVLMRA